MESSRRDLFIDVIVNGFMLKNNQLMLPPVSPITLKQGVGLPKTVVGFYCDPHFWTAFNEDVVLRVK